MCKISFSSAITLVFYYVILINAKLIQNKVNFKKKKRKTEVSATYVPIDSPVYMYFQTMNQILAFEEVEVVRLRSSQKRSAWGK